jgi:hypothetical protein
MVVKSNWSRNSISKSIWQYIGTAKRIAACTDFTDGEQARKHQAWPSMVGVEAAQMDAEPVFVSGRINALNLDQNEIAEPMPGLLDVDHRVRVDPATAKDLGEHVGADPPRDGHDAP